MSIGPGGVVQIRVPGMSQPLSVRISGITDVSRAKSLFYSREGKQLEQFVYVRNSVIVGPEVFSKTIIPAFQNVTTAPGTSFGVNRSSRSTSSWCASRSTPIPQRP